MSSRSRKAERLSRAISPGCHHSPGFLIHHKN
jgi:hypothetical protein